MNAWVQLVAYSFDVKSRPTFLLGLAEDGRDEGGRRTSFSFTNWTMPSEWASLVNGDGSKRRGHNRYSA